jgi:hypothetical protein
MDLTFPPILAERFKSIELDISKYDKSQALLALEFDLALMEMFGVDPMLRAMWKEAHISTTLVSYSSRFRVNVNFQRKSGDAFTLLGTLH